MRGGAVDMVAGKEVDGLGGMGGTVLYGRDCGCARKEDGGCRLGSV